MDEETDVLLAVAELVVELVVVETADDADGEDDDDADPEAVELDAPVAFTVMVPFIQAGWMEQS
jgi:hypothetical protein